MTGVGKKLAPKIVAEVARLEATSRIYVMSSRKVNERQARDVTLAAALRDLAQMPVTKLALVTGLGAVGTDTYRLLQSAVTGHLDFAGRPLGARLAPEVLRAGWSRERRARSSPLSSGLVGRGGRRPSCYVLTDR
ncbi:MULTISPECIES: hypothetical protein [Rhodococcus]|uniref:hypothetical protein n=1 Tax=Rhodococcus TaxID=1827 RepID=UPI0002A40EFE|nr:hypothetical protein [Rhodococcus opacus]ELB94160.1 hypothetical protein Rwratislav_05323 [Rhodococcus wratislaviensis IFP 2016]NHU47462.1 hypothetical protein [Rhodococcus sp. A14]MDX5966351.1 hypothetical protein [Rhodococcus opacus]NKY71689.1 hypothetical protein [Rhodococcus opacus]QZS60006.1 hypothetical protein FXW36_13010 [Rhodococcus opacus]